MKVADFALWATILWFAVLFGGAALVSKTKLRNGKRGLAIVLAAIPALYVIALLVEQYG